MSGEMIAIVAVGVALAGLILTSVRGLRQDMQAQIGGLRGEIAGLCAARSQRFTPRLLNCANAWRTWKGCWKGCGKPSVGGRRLAKGMSVWRQVVALPLCACLLASCSMRKTAAQPSDCANWNSNEYFEAATAADVTDCLRSGADLEARTEDGLTPLQDGLTPLHWAARGNENPAVIAALLDAGADLKARTEGTVLAWLDAPAFGGQIYRESRRYHRVAGRRGGSQGANRRGWLDAPARLDAPACCQRGQREPRRYRRARGRRGGSQGAG